MGILLTSFLNRPSSANVALSDILRYANLVSWWCATKIFSPLSSRVGCNLQLYYRFVQLKSLGNSVSQPTNFIGCKRYFNNATWVESSVEGSTFFSLLNNVFVFCNVVFFLRLKTAPVKPRHNEFKKK